MQTYTLYSFHMLSYTLKFTLHTWSTHLEINIQINAMTEFIQWESLWIIPMVIHKLIIVHLFNIETSVRMIGFSCAFLGVCFLLFFSFFVLFVRSCLKNVVKNISCHDRSSRSSFMSLFDWFYLFLLSGSTGTRYKLDNFIFPKCDNLALLLLFIN